MRIVVDGMGGDNAPKAVVGGVVEAIKEYNVEIVVTGDKDLLEKEFSNYEFDRSKLEIVHTTEIIENEASSSYKKKKRLFYGSRFEYSKRKESRCHSFCREYGCITYRSNFSSWKNKRY